MPEPHGEEKRDEDLPPQEQEELDAFQKALERLGSKRELSPDFHRRLIDETRREKQQGDKDNPDRCR